MRRRRIQERKVEEEDDLAVDEDDLDVNEDDIVVGLFDEEDDLSNVISERRS